MLASSGAPPNAGVVEPVEIDDDGVPIFCFFVFVICENSIFAILRFSILSFGATDARACGGSTGRDATVRDHMRVQFWPRVSWLGTSQQRTQSCKPNEHSIDKDGSHDARRISNTLPSCDRVDSPNVERP